MPRLEFDPEKGMSAPETAELREIVAANWRNAFARDGAPTIDTDASTPAGQLVDGEAAALAQCNSEFLFLSQQLNPRVAEGPWQDGIGYIYFLERKVAQPTQVAVVCGGIPGTVIPAGAQIKTKDNVRYECPADTAIGANSRCTVTFRGVEAGPIECPAGALTNYKAYGEAEIVSAVSGWTSVRNSSPGVLDEETGRMTVACTCGGTPGTAIPAGSVVKSEDGYLYESAAGAVLGAATAEDPDGYASVTFVCQTAGRLDCPVDALTNEAVKLADGSGTIVTVIPGWDTVRNSAAGALGWNRESQWDFEARRYASVAKNSHGSAASIQGSIWDIENVVDCVVLENAGSEAVVKHGVTIPPHSIAMSVFGGDDAEIAKAVYMKKDAGCGTCLHEPGFDEITYADPESGGAAYTYGIIRPETVDVFIRVTYHVNASTSAGEPEIRQAVLSDFNGQNEDSGNVRVGMAQTLYASRFAVAVVKTAGVSDLVSVEVALGSASGFSSSIEISAWTEPVLSTGNIIVVKQ